MRTTAAHREGWTQDCLRNHSTLTLCGVRPHIRTFWAPHWQPENREGFCMLCCPLQVKRRDPRSACSATALCKTLVLPKASKPSTNLFKSPLSGQTYFLILLQPPCSLIIHPALLQQLCQLGPLKLQWKLRVTPCNFRSAHCIYNSEKEPGLGYLSSIWKSSMKWLSLPLPSLPCFFASPFL